MWNSLLFNKFLWNTKLEIISERLTRDLIIRPTRSSANFFFSSLISAPFFQRNINIVTLLYIFFWLYYFLFIFCRAVTWEKNEQNEHNSNGFYKFNVYRKRTKLSSPWTNKTPERYKQNTINDDLHLSKRISSNFDKEINLIKETLRLPITFH